MNYLDSATPQFIRLSDVLSATGRSKTSLWSDQQKGLFPKPIKLGGESARSAHYLASEVNAVLIARAAEQSDEQVKDLVSKLTEQRKELLVNLLAQFENVAA